MAVAVPPSPAPAGPSVAAPVAPPAPPPPPTGDLADAGGSRRDAVRAHRWTTSGATKVLGDVEVDLAELHGLVSIRGALKAQSMTARGTLDVGGPVEVAGSLSVDGETTFRAGVRAGQVETRGAATIVGDLAATQSLRTTGTIQVGGSVTAPRLEFDGRLEVTGSIVVADFIGRLTGTSRATTLQADRVVVRRGGFRGRRATFEVRTIETKEADLEGVVAEYIRADRIAVGPGCQIARIDGEVTRVHASSHVGPVSRSPAPYGLTR